MEINFHGAFSMASPLVSSDGVIDLYTVHRFCYEVNTIRPCPPITGLYKRNFGFFYNALGKALFIIFMGLLCFGVEAGSLGVITGLAVAIDGGLLILLFLKYPHMYPKD